MSVNDIGTNYDKDRFIVVDFDTAWNPNLSLKAVGLWVRCTSHNSSWKIHKSRLVKEGKEKKTAITSAMKELEEEKLLMVITHRIIGIGPDGKKINRIWGNEYVFFKKPRTDKELEAIAIERKEEIQKYFLKAGFLSEGKQEEGNRTLTKNNRNYKEKETTDKVVDEVVDSSKNEEKGSSVLTEKQVLKLKSLDPTGYQDAYDLMLEQSNDIMNPYGWMKNCLKNKWHENKKYQKKSREENKKFAIKIIKEFEDALLPGSSFDLSDEAFIIQRGTKTMSYVFGKINFKEEVQKELKFMGFDIYET